MSNLFDPIQNKNLLTDRFKIKTKDGLEVVSQDTNETTENDAILGKDIILQLEENGIDGCKIKDNSIAASKLITETTDEAAASVTSILLQQVRKISTTAASSTTAIPTDTTIPQNTEGSEFITLSITPKDPGNILMIEFIGVGGGSELDEPAVALFQDSTENALSVTGFQTHTTSTLYPISLRYFMTSGTTNSITFKIRFGPSVNTRTAYIGRNHNGATYGGTLSAVFTITEFKV